MSKQSIPEVDHTKLVARLKQTILDKKMSARAWSIKATKSPDTVRNIIRGGSKSPRIDTLRKLADSADKKLEFFTGTTDDPSNPGSESLQGSATESGNAPVRLVGYVGPGEKIFHFGIGEARFDVPAPPGVARGLAAIVRGDSMSPGYRNGDLVIAREHLGQIEEMLGKDCFVQVTDGPLYLKILRKGTKGRFHLESYDDVAPIPNQTVEWAAPVCWIKRA